MEDIVSLRAKTIIENAYRESPFYRERWGKEADYWKNIRSKWQEIPVISKPDMIMAEESIVSPKYYQRETMGAVVQETTSGSTGQCLPIYWDKFERNRSMLPLWLKRKQYYGIFPSDRHCYFYTVHNRTGKESKERLYKAGLGFSKMNLTEERIAEIYERMLEYQPVWMILQPSIAIILARYLFESGAEPIESLKYIELTGEMYTEQNKRFIENAFECPTASQYGTYEVNSIAYECPEGHMHIMGENVFAEILHDGKEAAEGEEGDIVVTSLHNTIMPFIRYNTGDWGRIKKVPCRWCSERVLELTRGRKNDMILCDTGESYSAYEFVKIFANIFEMTDGDIFQYQVEQTGYREFKVYVVTDEPEENIKTLFSDNLFNDYLKECTYHFIFQKELFPEDGTGKLRMFRSLLKEE